MNGKESTSSNNSSGDGSCCYPVLTKEIAFEIFESKAPYKDDEEKEACKVRTIQITDLATRI